MIRDVSELEVYQVAMGLLEGVYSLTNQLPRSERHMVDQLRRAAKSIPANIAEGFGKKVYPKEFKRYLMIAMGSSDECVTHLRTLYVVTPRFRPQTVDLANKFKILSKRLNKLRTSWLAD